MRRTDQSVGPNSWYWPTWVKLLAALAIAIAVLILFIVVNPGTGSG